MNVLIRLTKAQQHLQALYNTYKKIQTAPSTHRMLTGLKAGAQPLRKRRHSSSVTPLRMSGWPCLLIICVWRQGVTNETMFLGGSSTLAWTR